MAAVESRLCGGQQYPLPVAADRRSRGDDPGKKTTEAIQQEVAREVEHLLALIFRERRHQGRLDLEAVEMAIRSALRQAGAAALSELLKYDPRNRSSEPARVPVATLPSIVAYTPRPSSPRCVPHSYCSPTSYVRTAITASFLRMSNFMLKTPNCLRGYVVCWP